MFFIELLFAAADSSTAEPNPQAPAWSSTVIMAFPFSSRVTIFVSTGLAKRPLITSAAIFSSANISAAFKASVKILP